MQTTIGHKLKVGTHSEQEKLNNKRKNVGWGEGEGGNIDIII